MVTVTAGGCSAAAEAARAAAALPAPARTAASTSIASAIIFCLRNDADPPFLNICREPPSLRRRAHDRGVKAAVPTNRDALTVIRSG
jgi:hypothetical protein